MNALIPLVPAEHTDARVTALFDEHGKNLTPGFYGEDPRVDKHSELIPETDAALLVSAIEAALRPAGFDAAKACAALLLGSYPASRLNDVDVFTGAILGVFHDYPVDIGRAAVNLLVRRLIFPPTAAEVAGACEDLVKDRRCALRTVKAHMTERERRREEAAKPKTTAATSDEVAAILESHGIEPSGPKEPFRAPTTPRGMDADQLQSAGLDGEGKREFWIRRMGVEAEEKTEGAE